MMKVKSVSQYTQSGSRTLQEDFIHCDPERGVFIVADGFGGGTAGLSAAQGVCESIKRFLYKEGQDEDATLPFILRQYFSLVGNVLFNAVLYANQTLHRLNQEKSIHERGGASAIAGYVDDQLLAIAQVGSCLAWMFRGDEFTPLVRPRTYSHLLHPFERKEDQDEDHQVPLMAYGMYPDLEPEIFEFQLRPDDWIVFASDGILAQGGAEDFLQKVLEIKQGRLSPEESVKSFNAYLKQIKSDDNLAVSLVIF